VSSDVAPSVFPFPALSGEETIPAHVPPELVRIFDFWEGLGDRPHEAVALLHRGPRVFYSPRHQHKEKKVGHWVLTKAEDMRRVLTDPLLFSSSASSFAQALGETWRLAPIEIDPPDHARFRALLTPMFSAARIGALNEEVQRRTQELVDELASQGGCEFVSAFAKRLPTSIFLSMVGWPLEELDQFLGWLQLFMGSTDADERRSGLRQMRDYMRSMIAERRRRPTDDFVSYALAANPEGTKLSDDEVLGFCVLLFLAGLDTVPNSLGFHFRHLAERPDHKRQISADPDILPSAIEELLRAYAIANPTRLVMHDTDLAGVAMKAGDYVTCSSILSGRDPDEYESPNEVRLTRGPRHLSFSFGIHHCIGAPLARRELAASISVWLERIPQFRIPTGAKVLTHGGGAFSVDALPLEW
jgi:cytochrome P450